MYNKLQRSEQRCHQVEAEREKKYILHGRTIDFIRSSDFTAFGFSPNNNTFVFVTRAVRLPMDCEQLEKCLSRVSAIENSLFGYFDPATAKKNWHTSPKQDTHYKVVQ